MRRAVFVVVAFVFAAACTGVGREAGTTTITAAAAPTGRDLPRSLRASSERIATEVCKHEEHCGRGTASTCINATTARAAKELRQWNCEPAAIRARFEECLVSFDSLGCDVVLRDDKRPLCPEEVDCDDHRARLIDPGPELEKIWQ